MIGDHAAKPIDVSEPAVATETDHCSAACSLLLEQSF
jgi:hypothetical protein